VQQIKNVKNVGKNKSVLTGQSVDYQNACSIQFTALVAKYSRDIAVFDGKGKKNNAKRGIMVKRMEGEWNGRGERWSRDDVFSKGTKLRWSNSGTCQLLLRK